ncbi:MAG: Lrp/AsnC family transcriptional regulator [Pseudomonadota bacterium]
MDKIGQIDPADRRLLAAAQKNVRLTAEQLGEACGLSPTAALKRLKKLRAHGVIEREVAVIAPKTIGLDVMAVVMVTLGRENRDVVDNFKRAIRETPQIMQGFYITGDADFLLTIVAKSMDAYEEFTRDFFYDEHQIQSFKTLVVLDPIKMGQVLPIE